MKKRVAFLLVGVLCLAFASTANAAVDPYVYTDAFIGESQYYEGKIRGKSYALTSNPNMTKLNVHGVFYSSGTKVEEGIGSTTLKNEEAYWFTKDGVYNVRGSYLLNTASRTYYNGGSYDQDYASDTWSW